jgi:glycosyltransferase involved in cell wall biosynthesis
MSERWDIHKPFVVNVADFSFDLIDIGGIAEHFRRVTPIIAARADATIFSSNYQQQYGVANYQFGNTFRVYNSRDILPVKWPTDSKEIAAQGRRVQAAYGLPPSYILAFHCAYHKDPITILRGFARARTFSPLVPPLVMAGHNTGLYTLREYVDAPTEAVKMTIQELGLQLGHDLFVAGLVRDDEIVGLYAGAKASVIASRSEGDLPAGVFETFAAGVPLIFGDQEVMVERLGTSGLYGTHFRVGEPGALAEKIVNVCDYPGVAQKQVERASRFGVRWSIEQQARAYLDIFAGTLGARHAT